MVEDVKVLLTGKYATFDTLPTVAAAATPVDVPAAASYGLGSLGMPLPEAEEATAQVLDARQRFDKYLREPCLGEASEPNVLVRLLNPALDRAAFWSSRYEKERGQAMLFARHNAAHCGTAILENKFTTAGEADAARRHLSSEVLKMLVLISTNANSKQSWLPEVKGMVTKEIQTDEELAQALKKKKI